jgi:hypothetical protein
VRPLIYVPIIHSEADLGGAGDEVRRQFEAVLGAAAWTQRYASVDAMWEGLHAKLLGLPLDWPSVRLYQDGLPVCGWERQIVSDLAAKGSRNHRLLSELMERGAALMGTEDPALLVAEYRRIQRLTLAAQQGEPGPVAEELKREGEDLLHRRDAFIAERIDSTVGEGETGILFLGLFHRVDELLNGKFEVRHLIHSLPFGTDPWRRLKESRHDGSEQG